MNKFVYREPSRDLKVIGEYDVIVIGGGPAGCSAAISAARQGADTLLIEKNGYLGGAAVSQLVCVILSTNGVDFQGIWHEYVRELEALNGISKLEPYPGYNYLLRACSNPEMIKLAWEKLVCKAGVTILYHCCLSDIVTEEESTHEEKISARGVVIETVAGRQAVMGKILIDCTGNGIACAKAGAEWTIGDGRGDCPMAATKVYRMVGVTANGCEKNMPDSQEIVNMETLWKKYIEDSSPFLEKTGYIPNFKKIYGTKIPGTNSVMMATSRVLRVNPIDPFSVTAAEAEGRQQAYYVSDFIQKYISGRKEAYLFDTSAEIGIRASRRIHGVTTVTDDDVMLFRKYPDEIAKGSWDIDIWPSYSYQEPSVARHTAQYQERIEKMKMGEYYSIRYGSLVVKGIDNMLMAGRCISSQNLAQASLRIQQTCMATGEAAGAAAALCVESGITPYGLSIEHLCHILLAARNKVPAAYTFLQV